jgi:hypothetical protein
MLLAGDDSARLIIPPMFADQAQKIKHNPLEWIREQITLGLQAGGETHRDLGLACAAER